MPRDLPEFAWVNTVLGNLKTTLAGAHHAFDYCKYATHYLAAFAYRLNRRFDLHTLVVRLIVAAARCKPRSEQVIRRLRLIANQELSRDRQCYPALVTNALHSRQP